MKTLFDRVYAPSPVETLLREFTFGNVRQLDSVLSEHLAGLCGQVKLLPGADVVPSLTSIRCCARCTDTKSRAPKH